MIRFLSLKKNDHSIFLFLLILGMFHLLFFYCHVSVRFFSKSIPCVLCFCVRKYCGREIYPSSQLLIFGVVFLRNNSLYIVLESLNVVCPPLVRQMHYFSGSCIYSGIQLSMCNFSLDCIHYCIKKCSVPYIHKSGKYTKKFPFPRFWKQELLLSNYSFYRVYANI